MDVLGIVAPHPPIMVPEVGAADADATRASAEALDLARDLLDRFAPETVVVMSPHGPAFRDAFAITDAERLHGDLGAFGAPQVSHTVPGDPALARAIFAAAAKAGIPTVPRPDDVRSAAGELDHGVLVPLSFLDRDGRWPMIEISLSYLPYDSHRRLGRAVREAAAALGRRVAFVASGDCSHRLKQGAPAGYSPRAALFDERLVHLLGSGDFDGLSHIEPRLVEEAGECGLRSFITLGGFLEGTDAVPRLLAYEGPWGVGYLTAVFAPSKELEAVLGPAGGLPEHSSTPDRGAKGGSKGADVSEPVRLARETIERYVRTGAVPDSPMLTDATLPQRAGAFVSIHQHGDLRGCIGTTGPTRDTLAEEIAYNAIQAATGDPRFPPITAGELDALEIGVDVLHDPEPIEGLDELDPRRYGVIVSCDWRRGLLLPDLEGVDTAQDQVAIASRKAGIAPGEPVRLERFRVDRHA